MSDVDLESLLAIGDADELRDLYRRAYACKLENCGRGVAMRGLIEAGNACAKDCLYCGIRRSNQAVGRYRLSLEEIVAAAEVSKSVGYESVVIQAGEIESEENTRFYEEVLRALSPLRLGITLSLGEQTESVYARWREAGARRYLLRIETSNPELYARIHPASCSHARRVECLRALRRCDYQVGTGVMCALPGQTVRDLANDIRFFREIDADMIGMGPYIPHPDTPLAAEDAGMSAAGRLELGLKMIAATRLYLGDVNIAASTALQALAPDGRERGIAAGANVIMPNVTDVRYRGAYHLYAGKPCSNETADRDRMALERSLAAIGEHPLYGVYGDSRHYGTGRRG